MEKKGTGHKPPKRQMASKGEIVGQPLFKCLDLLRDNKSHLLIASSSQGSPRARLQSGDRPEPEQSNCKKWTQSPVPYE